MTQPAHDRRRLDVLRAAVEGAQLAGELTAGALPRLCADAPLAADGVAHWQITGQRRPAAGGPPQVWLRVQATAPVVLTCQRCLQSMLLPLSVDRPIRFVDDEEEAERLDEEGEDDVLARPPRGFDALSLVEDELILALPLVPRHEHCAPEGASSLAADARANPFAVLASLKRPPSADGR